MGRESINMGAGHATVHLLQEKGKLTRFCLKSTPIVDIVFGVKTLSANIEMIDVFPTPLSPIIRNLSFWTFSCVPMK